MLRELRSLMHMLDNLEDDEEPQLPHRRAPRLGQSALTPTGPAVFEIPQSVEAAAPLVARPTTFIFDTDAAHAKTLAAILGATGAKAELFTETSQFVRGLLTTPPSLVFLDVTGQGDQAIDALFAMGERNFAGGVQLMGDSSPVVDVVRRMGERHALHMLPALRKPLETKAVRDVLISQNFTIAAPPATSLGEALSENWVEFWYQPKIDLARRTIAGVETFARIRHPQRGTLHPVVFLEDASERDLMNLSEKALTAALQAARDFSEVGIHLRVAVNIPVRALFDLPVIQMTREFGPPTDRWPGLLLDITAPQLTAEFPRVEAIGASLVACNIRIAIDDFGRSKLELPSLRQLPIAELKLDRALVQGIADDPKRIKCSESVIGLAHHLGAVAVAVGIERPADMKAMMALKCDVGQGFLFGQPMPRDELAGILMRRAVKEEAPDEPEAGAELAKPPVAPTAAPHALREIATSAVPSLRDIAAAAAPKKRHR